MNQLILDNWWLTAHGKYLKINEQFLYYGKYLKINVSGLKDFKEIK